MKTKLTRKQTYTNRLCSQEPVICLTESLQGEPARTHLWIWSPSWYVRYNKKKLFNMPIMLPF